MSDMKQSVNVTLDQMYKLQYQRQSQKSKKMLPLSFKKAGQNTLI